MTGGFVTEAGHLTDTSWFRAPMGHGVAAHNHVAGTAPHALAAGPTARVPGHVTGGIAGGVYLWRSAIRRPRLALRVDLEIIANHVYVIAQEGEFSTAQYSNSASCRSRASSVADVRVC